MENITDIFFDLDHTLWDFDKNSAIAFEKIFEKHQLTINLTAFVEVYLPINQSLWKLLQVDKISHEELRYNRLRMSFDHLNFMISDEEIYKISKDYIDYLPENNHLFEGANEILDYLYPKYNLHIITNGVAEVQEKKMINSNLRHYFKTVTNSEMAGVKKPHKNIFEFAVSLAKAEKNKSVMIGDCIEADFQGAINAGLNAILFDEKHIYGSNDIFTINHLLELKNIL